MSSVALEMPEVEQACYPQSSFAWFDIGADPAGWDALVRAESPNLFQLSPVLRAHSQGRRRPIGMLLQRPGRAPVAIGGLLRSRRGVKNISLLSFPPLTATQEPGLVGTLVDWLQAQRVEDITIGSFTSGVEGYRQPAGAIASERAEFVWHLDQSPEQRLHLLRRNHRRHLHKLWRQKLVLKRIGSQQSEWLTWLRIQWSHRRGYRLSLQRLARMYLYHRELRRHLSTTDTAHLYGLYHPRGTLLSAAYMLESGGTAFYMLGASSTPGYAINASLRLFWDLAEHYTERGFGQLHLGGVPAEAQYPEHEEHGVYRFKAGFGVKPVRRISLTVNNED